MTDTLTHAPRRQKRLYRDPNDTMIAGVASGVAKYFDVDTTLVRVLWASAVVFGGFGLIAYLLLWLILDDEPVEVRQISDVPGPTTTYVGEADGTLHDDPAEILSGEALREG